MATKFCFEKAGVCNIHVFTFTKGEEKLSMAYTTEGAGDMDVWAPIEDGWQFSEITTIQSLNESYDSLKVIWKNL